MTLDEARKRVTITVPETAALLGMSCNGAYRAVAAGEIPGIRVGRRIVVPVPKLLTMLGYGETDQASVA